MTTPQTISIQARNGTWKTISQQHPIPAWVVGLDELPEAIASRIGTHILKPPDVHVATPAVTVEPPAVTVMAPQVAVNVDLGTLEKYAKLGLYGLAGFGILQVVLIVVLIFVR